MAELFLLDERFRKFHGEVAGLDLLGELIGWDREGMLLVEGRHPIGQGVAIILAGDEAGNFGVEPVSARGAMAGGKNCGTVLECYAKYARATRGGEAQFVGQRIADEVARRNGSTAGGAADHRRGLVF